MWLGADQTGDATSVINDMSPCMVFNNGTLQKPTIVASLLETIDALYNCTEIVKYFTALEE